MFGTVEELIGAAAGSGPAGLADSDLTDAVEAAEGLRRRIDAAETALLAELDVRGVCDRDHGLSTTGWLARQAELPRSVARTRVKVAAALRSTLPAVADALADGRIGWDHARVFTTVTNTRNADAIDAVACELIDLAQGMVFDHWAHRVGYTARLLDPDGPTPPGLDANTVRVSRTLDGAVKVDATLVGTIGEVFAQAVEHRADVLYRRYRTDHHTNPDIAIPSRATLRALAMADLAGFPLHTHDDNDDDGLDVEEEGHDADDLFDDHDGEPDPDGDDEAPDHHEDDDADAAGRCEPPGGHNGHHRSADREGDLVPGDAEGGDGTNHTDRPPATPDRTAGLILPDGCRRPATRTRPGLVLPADPGVWPHPAPATRTLEVVLPDGRPALPSTRPPTPPPDLRPTDGDRIGRRSGPDPTRPDDRPDRTDPRRRRRRRRSGQPPPTRKRARTGPGRPEILLVAHAGHPGALSTPDGLALDDEWARAIACDADWHPVVVDSLGVPLTAGRTIRHATLAQRRAIRLRDGGCVYPGCDAPFRWCDLHHITPWTAHGPTDTDNLAALCRRHHGVTHRTGWTMDTTPDQWFTWTTPTGHTIGSQRHHRTRGSGPEGTSPGEGRAGSAAGGARRR